MSQNVTAINSQTKLPVMSNIYSSNSIIMNKTSPKSSTINLKHVKTDRLNKF